MSYVIAACAIVVFVSGLKLLRTRTVCINAFKEIQSTSTILANGFVSDIEKERAARQAFKSLSLLSLMILLRAAVALGVSWALLLLLALPAHETTGQIKEVMFSWPMVILGLCALFFEFRR